MNAPDHKIHAFESYTNSDFGDLVALKMQELPPYQRVCCPMCGDTSLQVEEFAEGWVRLYCIYECGALLGPRCPQCGGLMRRRHRRKDGAGFWGCRGYPRCEGIVNGWKAA
jgi:hypothetical protein